MRFTCDLDVPRTDDKTGIPTTWARDDTISYGARGVLARLLVLLAPGEVATDGDLDLWRRPEDPSVVEMVGGELRRAGYLRRQGDSGGESYSLVHPDRLGPLPTS